MKHPSPAERRSELRKRASGPVILRHPASLTGPIIGALIDSSPTGFRCRHDCLTLAAGHEVTFQFHGRTGAARAVWVRIQDGEAESGFQILSVSDPHPR
jgi:hypothetical protein